mgnify:CR=1 FL=1
MSQDFYFLLMPGFSAIVDIATLKANDYNLNIRRYADNAPPPEPRRTGPPPTESATSSPP